MKKIMITQNQGWNTSRGQVCSNIMMLIDGFITKNIIKYKSYDIFSTIFSLLINVELVDPKLKRPEKQKNQF